MKDIDMDVNDIINYYSNRLIERGYKVEWLKAKLSGFSPRSAWYWIESLVSGKLTISHLKIALAGRVIIKFIHPRFGN